MASSSSMKETAPPRIQPTLGHVERRTRPSGTRTRAMAAKSRPPPKATRARSRPWPTLPCVRCTPRAPSPPTGVAKAAAVDTRRTKGRSTALQAPRRLRTGPESRGPAPDRVAEEERSRDVRRRGEIPKRLWARLQISFTGVRIPLSPLMLAQCRTHGYYRGERCPLCDESGRFVMKDHEVDRIGRMMALILRHQPERFGLSMDGRGWVDLDGFVQAICDG